MNKKHNDQQKRFMVYLPPELMEKLRSAAKTDYRSLSAELRFILEQYFGFREEPADWLRPKTDNQGDQSEPKGKPGDEEAEKL